MLNALRHKLKHRGDSPRSAAQCEAERAAAAEQSSVASFSTRRLKKDLMRLKKDPVPFVDANPLPSNILEWHYVVCGPAGTPYEGGFYHGKLVFPVDYPFKPPAIYMITPNGRFKVNVRLCLSISDSHPETWNPAWSVSTILAGLLSFMLDTKPTVGSLQTLDTVKQRLATESLRFNLDDSLFCQLLPDSVDEIHRRLASLYLTPTDEQRRSA